MSNLSARLKMPFLLPSQAQKHVTHNEALVLLDALVQTGITAFSVGTPPADPPDGALYALGGTPTGDWAGEAGMLALRMDSSWRFIAPQTGWRAWDLGGGRLMVFDGSDWGPLAPEFDNLTGVGIGTVADDTNRLALSADASLLSHAGGGHQVKVNKSAAGETASLLFQSDWTGHAEMGLAGSTDFAIKVSADGASWTDALIFDGGSGVASGAAVQQSATDTTPGRLMRSDWGYGPGNILGSVTEAAGQPTGAVIERGSTAAGEYLRLADGTQICWIRADLSYDTGQRLSFDWTFPQTFGGAGFPVITANLENEFGATPGPSRLHGPFARQGNSPSSTGCTIRLYRSSEAPDFASGDTLPVQAMAIGRWF